MFRMVKKVLPGVALLAAMNPVLAATPPADLPGSPVPVAIGDKQPAEQAPVEQTPNRPIASDVSWQPQAITSPLDTPFSAPSRCGLFGAFSVELLKPHISNHMQALVNVNPLGTDLVPGLQAEMDATGAPRLELGYRFDGGWEILVGYRSLVSDGSDVVPDFDILGDGDINSRINMNVVDIDFGKHVCLGPDSDLILLGGARLTSLYFGSQVIGAIMEQQTSYNLFGAGPHAAAEYWHSLTPRLAAFARLEGGCIIGQYHEAFQEVLTFSPQAIFGGATDIRDTTGIPFLSVQAGLGWSIREESPFRFAFGYQYEHWWNLGSSAGTGAALEIQGAFLRGELFY